MLSLLELPFSTAYWPCLMPPHTGEVHSGGAGKPGAVQKVFCPSAEAEQPKHEGIVWSVHGEYRLRKKRERKKKQKQKNLFCNPVVCQGWGSPLCVSRRTCACVRVCVWGARRRGSQTGQLTADSDGELQHWKVCPSGALYFSNNTPLVRLFYVYDLNK